MRTVILFCVLCIPSLIAVGTAHAAAPGTPTKPACTHYDAAAIGKRPASASAAAASASTPPPARPEATPTAATSLFRSGGDTTELRPHDAPRWQAFLPGMFR